MKGELKALLGDSGKYLVTGKYIRVSFQLLADLPAYLIEMKIKGKTAVLQRIFPSCEVSETSLSELPDSEGRLTYSLTLIQELIFVN